MEVIEQYLKEEFAEKKEAVHQLKQEVEEEALVVRRSRRSNDAAKGTTTVADVARCGYQIVEVSPADAEMKLSGSEEVDGNNNNDNEDKSKNSVYLDESAGMWKCRHCIWTYQIGNPWVDHIHQKHFSFGCRGALQEGSHVEKLPKVANLKDVDIQKILSAVINGKNVEILKDDTFLSSSTLPPSTKTREEDGTTSQGSIKNETEHLKIDIVDESDEEVLELEFERAVEKMRTHEYNMYCPNCSNRITKVILRRRKREKRTQSKDLLGCLSCFSIFIPKGNILDPFKIFGNREGPQGSRIRPEQKPWLAPGSTVQQQHKPGGPIPGVKGPNNNASIGSSGKANGISTTDGSTSNGSLIIDMPDKLNGTTEGTEHPIKPTSEIEEGQNVTDGQYPGTEVQFPPEQGPVPTEPHQMENILDTRRSLIADDAPSSYPLEILKSIVYGGLMELITSLSIVSSAAASHATTLNIVALGVANLIGGLIVLFHNLKDLRYEEPNEAKGRYLKLLGRKENVVLHTIFSVLSYLVFGLIPPVVYGFTFFQTEDGDLKLVAVAASSLVCILILATAKAFTNGQHQLKAYSKTIGYYITGAAMASGIAYAAGHLLERFMDNLGWFEAKRVQHLLIPEHKSWASF